MTTNLLLSKVSQDGRQIEIKADGEIVQAHVAGQVVGAGLARMTVKVIGSQTYVAVVGGKVALTQVEYDAVRRAHGIYLSSRPETEVEPADLRSQRQSLLDEIGGCEDEADQRYWREHARGDSDAGWRARSEWDAKAAAARQCLAAFDAAHPEILGQVRRERAEDAERFLRYD